MHLIQALLEANILRCITITKRLIFVSKDLTR